MAANMDERVVSMEFDNKQFEKNVKTSMKTLDDLKESLDFDETGESFDKVTAKFKKFGKENVFKDVDDSVGSLRKSIGLLGDSAGGLISQFAEVTKITAMFELAEQAVYRLKAAVKSFTIDPISQGFEKYTTKIGSIKTIANATGLTADKVDESLERLNWFTDETSASFSEMVSNIGKFTSVGKGLDESITAMQGIATWGYHSGASVTEQTRAMYNLSQALGTGTVKLIDWKSIENAGMATKEFKEQAIAAAEAAGTLKRKGDELFTSDGKTKVTSENFNETLAKGWFTSDVLMDTLKEYGSFADKVRQYQEEHPQYALASEAMEAMDAERLKKQNDIYDKYLDTWSKNAGKTSAKIKEDIARINKITSVKEREKEVKSFAESVGMSYEETKKVLDDLAATEETLGEKAFKSSQQSKSFNDSIEATKDAVSTGWMNTFQYIFGGLDKSIELWSDVTEILWDLFAAGASFRNNAFMHWAEEFNGWADLWNANEDNGPLGALRNIMDTIIELKDLLGSSFRNVFFPQLAKITGEITGEEDVKTMTKNGLKTVDQLKNWREGHFMGYQIKQVTKGIREFTAKIREFFTNAENLEKIRNIFTTIATVVRFATSVVGSFFSAIGNFVTKSGILQDILNVLTRVANKITEIFNKLQSSGFIQKLFGKISDGFAWFYNLVKGWIKQIEEFFDETGIGQMISDWFNGIIEWFTGSEKDVDENGKKTESGFFRSFEWLKNIKAWFENINLKDILYSVKDFVANFGEIWSAFTVALGGGELDKKGLKDSGLSENVQGVITKAWDFGSKLAGVWNFIKGIFDTAVGWLESSGILPAIRGFWDNIKTFFSNIGRLWDIFVKGKEVNPKDLDEKQKGLVDGIRNFLNRIQNVWGKVKSWFDKAWAWVKEKWGLLVGWLESSGILPKVREIWTKIKTVFANFSEVWAAFTAGLSGQKIDKKALKDSGMDKGLMGIVEGVWNFGNRINDAIQNVKEKWGKVKDWLETSGILPTLRSWWSSITEWFENVKKDIEENGVFQTVSDFFTNLWEKVTGLFGNESPLTEIVESTTQSTNTGSGEKKGGFFQGIIDAFTNEQGNFDLLQGLTTGISELFKYFGAMDWTGMSTNFFGAVVSVINGLDDAMGELHIDNIIEKIQQIVGAFTGVMVVKSIMDVTSTIRTIVKKGKDKSLLEKFTELLQSIGTAILQIGIAFALIAGSIWLLSTIKPEDLTKALLVMGAIALFFVGMIAVAALFNTTKNGAQTLQAMAKAFINLGIAIGIIVASIVVLSILMNTGANVWGALGMVALIMVAMVGVIWAMSEITKGNLVRISAGIAVFAGMAILLGTITVCLLLLQGVNWGKALADLILLAAAMAGIVFAMKALDKVKISAKTMTTMIIMAVIIGVITAAFVLLKDADPGTIAVIAGSLAVVVLALAGAVKIMESIGPGALKGAVIFSVALVIIVGALALAAGMVSVAAERTTNAVATVMSNLAAASNSAKLIDGQAIQDALGLLDDICTALGKTMAVDTKNALAVADAAWDVFTELKLASFAAILVSEKQFEKIFGKDGNGGLLQLIQTGMSSVTDTGWKASALGRSVETLAENLKLVGQAGLTINKSLEDYDGQTYAQGIQNVKEQLTAIQEIVDIATAMGTIGEGEDAKQFDLTSFAKGIANVGAALELYNIALAEAFKEEVPDGVDVTGDSIPTINTESINAALTSVMTAMKDVKFDEGEVGNVESWAGLKTGEDGGTLFALGLTNIANAMGVFGESAKNFNSGDVDKAIESLDKLADIKAKFETNSPSDYKGMMDGVGEWGDGGDFKTAISGMGTAIVAFGESVKDLPENAVTKATDALDTLAVIYEKLSKEGTVEDYIAKIGSLTIGGTTTTVKSVKDTFTGFAEGISKLADGLAAFSGALTNEEIGYDQTKVDAAIKVLQDMTKIETDLKGVEVSGDWWNNLLFGENGIKKLGENMSGLGSRLATFSQELTTDGGFDIDVGSDLWKNITGVIQFLADIQTQMNNITLSTDTYEEGNGRTRIDYMAYTLVDLADGINALREKLLALSRSMNEVNKVGDREYTLGQWDTSKFENIKKMISFFKDIAIDLKNAGIEKGKFYNLSDFGNDLGAMFVNMRWSEFHEVLSEMDNFKNLADALHVLTDSSDTEFSTKGFALAAELISGFASRLISMDDVDGKGTMNSAFASLLSEIDKHVNDFEPKGKTAGEKFASGFGQNDRGGNPTLLNDLFTKLLSSIAGYEQQFYDKGKAAGNKYTEGFINKQNDDLFGWGLTSHSVFESSITETLTNVLTWMDDYLGDYTDKGKSAGEAYAAGFNEALSGAGTGTLTPIVAMDASGKTATATGLGAILTTMGYATSADIITLADRLDTLNSQFNNPINVDDAHKDIVDKIGEVNTTLDKLETIKNDLSSLKKDVYNLKVYMDTGKLVGEIAEPLNRALGNTANVSP